PRPVQRLHFGRTNRSALLQHERTLAQGVNRDAANRVLRNGRPELHAAASFGSRSWAVISAMIATAISDGETAPIGSPIGARMRAISLCFAPCALRRLPRLAWVFREPSAPI